MTKNDKYHYDYIIIGNGLAGFQLALAFAQDPFFDQKSIALIDKSKKDHNDKTWCFWEIGNGKWESIINKTWQKSRFVSPNVDLTTSFSPFKYKMIRSLDFYDYAKSILSNKPNFQSVEDCIESSYENHGQVYANGKHNQYSCTHLFDSRIPPDFEIDKRSTKILQHFKGYLIETKHKAFNPDIFTMMDYRKRFKDSTSFVYILPLTPNKALVEYTFFTDKLVTDTVYDLQLTTYINEILLISDYNILESEQGVIPMTDFDFSKFNTKDITKIGTAGGWVKGSTGYSFKHTEKKVAKILLNIKSGNRPSKGLINRKHKFYDSIFLNVLYKNNSKGMTIFEKFYTKNDPKDYLEFLDESSDLSQELKIMQSLFSKEFVNGFIDYLGLK